MDLPKEPNLCLRIQIHILSHLNSLHVIEFDPLPHIKYYFRQGSAEEIHLPWDCQIQLGHLWPSWPPVANLCNNTDLMIIIILFPDILKRSSYPDWSIGNWSRAYNSRRNLSV